MAAPNLTSVDVEEYTGEDIPSHARVIFIVVGSLYTIIGVLGNIVIITTIFVTKTMRNPHFYFIVNLAVSDLLITGYVIPNLVASLSLGYYPVVDFRHCIFNGFVIVCAYVSSLLSLMVISINRYLSVCHGQLFSRCFSNKILSSIFGCSLIWLLAFLSSLPCLVGWGRFKFDTKTHYCGYDRTYSFSYTLFLMLFSIGIPVAVVFACNFAMWRFVRQASHRIYAMTQTQRHSSDKQKLVHSDYTTNAINIASSSCSSSRNIRPSISTSNEQPIFKIDECEDMIECTMKMPGDFSDNRLRVDHDARITDEGSGYGVEITSVTGTNKNVGERTSHQENGIIAVKSMSDDNHFLQPDNGTAVSDLTPVEKRPIRSMTTTEAQLNNDTRCTPGSLETQKDGGKFQMTPKKSPSRSRRDLKKALEPEKSSGVLVTPDELALIKTIFIIFIAFAVLMTPYMMSTLLDTTDQWSSVAHLSCSFTSFTNSCLNCVLYGLMTPAFKKAYKKLLAPCCASFSSGTGGKQNNTNTNVHTNTINLPADTRSFKAHPTRITTTTTTATVVSASCTTTGVVTNENRSSRSHRMNYGVSESIVSLRGSGISSTAADVSTA